MKHPHPSRRERGEAASEVPVVVYGTNWCPQTTGVRRHLDRRRVPYLYRDIEADPRAEARVLRWERGRRKFPVVHVADTVLVEPAGEELDRALADNGLA